MKKFFKALTVFLVLLPFIMVGGLFVWGLLAPKKLQKNVHYKAAGYGHMLTRLREADTTKNADALVVGSSHAYRGVDPRIFAQQGVRIFNLGSGSQSPIQTLYLLNKYVDKIKPKVVLYEVYFATFGTDGVESAVDLYSNVKPLDKGLFDMAKQINGVQSYNTLLYAWLRQLFIKKAVKEPVKKNKDTYIKGGYVERQITLYKKGKGKIIANKFVFNNDQVMAFNQIVALLKSKHIKLVLFQTPVTKNMFSTVSDPQTFDKFMTGKGSGYYNFNYNPNFTDADFFDSNHLNQNGVNKFDPILIDSLKANKQVAPLLFK